MIVVMGTSKSGKSAFAEKLITESFSGRKLYIATMIPFGKEGEERVRKHRKMREGKGFETIECPCSLDKLSGTFGAAILLECLSNLVGNEMHLPANAFKSDEELLELIADEVKVLSDNSRLFVVVTNEFEQKDDYDEETRRYIRLTSMVNKRMLELADEVYDMRENGKE